MNVANPRARSIRQLARAAARLRDRLRSFWAWIGPAPPWPIDRGEQAAARYLTGRGWELLDANLRIGHDEGDLLCLDEQDVPVLVEVKASSGGPIDPVFHVDAAKAACLRRLALALATDPRWRGRVPRIDVITVRLANDPCDDAVIDHYRQAVEDGHRPRRRGVLRP
jgi:putative endonuclease